MARSTLRAAKAAAALTPEIVEIFGAPPLCGDDCDPMLREQAQILADARLAIRRI